MHSGSSLPACVLLLGSYILRVVNNDVQITSRTSLSFCFVCRSAAVLENLRLPMKMSFLNFSSAKLSSIRRRFAFTYTAAYWWHQG